MPFADLFADTGIRTLAGTVTDLDVDAHEVEIRGGDGLATRLGFDHLVYALGSRADTSTVPGAAQHAHVLDTATTTEDLHRELAAAPRARVAVVGGGLTGVETAAEIAEADPDRPVTLITSAPVGAGISDRGRRYLENVLDRLGVQILDDTSVARVDEGGLTTTTGQEIAAELVIWSAGLAVPDLAARSDLATDEDGRVMVDATLRSISHPEVFAAGDSARPVEHVGAPVRASAYVATIMGAQAGTNLARTLAGKDPKPLRFGYLMQSVSLGRRDGIVQFTDGNDQPRRWVATGRLAALIKEFVERIMVVGLFKLERRLPGAFAWRPAPRKQPSQPAPAAHTPAAYTPAASAVSGERSPVSGTPGPRGGATR